jgi:hypothetical protein
MTVQGMPMPTRDPYGAALARVTEGRLFDGEPDDDAQRIARRTLEEALSVLGGEEHERYVALYGEVVAIAALARARYGEAPLARDQLEAFHEHLLGFLNSWVHRHGHP